MDIAKCVVSGLKVRDYAVAHGKYLLRRSAHSINYLVIDWSYIIGNY